MAKRKTDPLHMVGNDWRDILIDLTNSSDRATVIVGAAALDALLEQLIRLFLVNDKDTDDLFRSGSGPLDSFGVRITMSYYLGLISKDERTDLKTIQGIRNDFAHNWRERSFSEQLTKDKCLNLLYAKKWKDELAQAGWSNTPRDWFIATIGGLVRLLLMRTSSGVLAQRRKVPAEIKAPPLSATPPPSRPWPVTL